MSGSKSTRLRLADYVAPNGGLGKLQRFASTEFSAAQLYALYLFGTGHDYDATFDYSRKGRTLVPVGTPTAHAGYASVNSTNHYQAPFTGAELAGEDQKATVVVWARSADVAFAAAGCWDTSGANNYGVMAKLDSDEFRTAWLRAAVTTHRAATTAGDAGYTGFRQVAGVFDAEQVRVVHDRPGLTRETVLQTSPTVFPTALSTFLFGGVRGTTLQGLFTTNVGDIAGAALFTGELTLAELTELSASAAAYWADRELDIFQ